MKANELMIGDWVYDNDYPMQITEIKFRRRGEPPYKLIGSLRGDGLEMENISLDYIEPIPLTPEILEKNGFGCDRNDGYAILRLEDNSELLYYFHEYKLTRFYKSEIIFRCQCVYAHQLQHALKLCGIDKDIIV